MPIRNGAEIDQRLGAAVSPIHLLHRANQAVTDMFGRESSNLNMTLRQFVLLTAIGADCGGSQTDLIASTGIDRSTMTDIVCRLIRKGWVRRRRSKRDSRAYELTLTVAGRSVVGAITPAVSRIDKKLLSALPEPDRQRFIDDLNTFIVSLTGFAVIGRHCKTSDHDAPRGRALTNRRIVHQASTAPTLTTERPSQRPVDAS